LSSMKNVHRHDDKLPQQVCGDGVDENKRKRRSGGTFGFPPRCAQIQPSHTGCPSDLSVLRTGRVYNQLLCRLTTGQQFDLFWLSNPNRRLRFVSAPPLRRFLLFSSTPSPHTSCCRLSSWRCTFFIELKPSISSNSVQFALWGVDAITNRPPAPRTQRVSDILAIIVTM
jgi:hypothetical protein